MSNEGDLAREPVLMLQRSNVPGREKGPRCGPLLNVA